jgi:hypothetical protein
MPRFRLFLGFLAATALSLGCRPTHADTDAPLRCATLLTNDLSGLADAPTQLTSAQYLERNADRPDACHVSGYVAANVGFAVALPADWNGKLIQLGCGGFCGSADLGYCDPVLRRGYACAVSDNGHKSTGADALWAYDNLQAEVDHAFRAAHVTAVASKALVERYYGRAATHAYFNGASTGGRQALMEAQRFPWDFDGIIAGSPSLSVAGVHMNLLWGNRAFNDQSGRPLFTQVDLDVLNRAVIARCDLNDGVADGLIGDPRTCSFAPEELRCAGRKRDNCLSLVQVEAVKKIYAGASSSKGESLYMPGALKGSEQTWLDWFSTLFTTNPRGTYNFVRQEFRYAAFQPDPGPGWKPEDFDFDRDYKRFGVTEGLSAAVNPDLRRFKAAGGKLLAYAGWSDAAGMPLHTVDYYETVEKVLGGKGATQDFFRLFVIPGMGHGPGNGAYAVDWLSYLESWVERDQPPNEVLSSHVRYDDLQLGNPDHARRWAQRVAFPLDPAYVTFTRPVYPYPTTVKYSGRGDPNVAASFVPAEPAVPMESSAQTHDRVERSNRAGN